MAISANALAVSLDSSNPNGTLNMCLYPSRYIKNIAEDIEGSIYTSTPQSINSGDERIAFLTSFK